MTHGALRWGTLGTNGIGMMCGKELQYRKGPAGTGGKVSRDAWDEWSHPQVICRNESPPIEEMDTRANFTQS